MARKKPQFDIVLLYKYGVPGQKPDHDYEYLRYVFRSIQKYTPWFRYIYFVTADQVPIWLNINNEKLRVVRYADFIPAKYLPNANRNVASLYLDQIPDITQQFIVLDGDEIITKPLKDRDFFHKGVPYDAALFDIPAAESPEDIRAHVMMNNAGVLNAYFDKAEVLKLQHGKFFSRNYGDDANINRFSQSLSRFTGFAENPIPYACTIEMFANLRNRLGILIDEVSRNSSESKYDVNMTLVRAWNMCEGNFIPMKTKTVNCFELGVDKIDQIDKAIQHHKYRMVGFTDSTDENDFLEIKNVLLDALQVILPDMSSFERILKITRPATPVKEEEAPAADKAEETASEKEEKAKLVSYAMPDEEDEEDFEEEDEEVETEAEEDESEEEESEEEESEEESEEEESEEEESEEEIEEDETEEDETEEEESEEEEEIEEEESEEESEEEEESDEESEEDEEESDDEEESEEESDEEEESEEESEEEESEEDEEEFNEESDEEESEEEESEEDEEESEEEESDDEEFEEESEEEESEEEESEEDDEEFEEESEEEESNEESEEDEEEFDEEFEDEESEEESEEVEEESEDEEFEEESEEEAEEEEFVEESEEEDETEEEEFTEESEEEESEEEDSEEEDPDDEESVDDEESEEDESVDEAAPESGVVPEIDMTVVTAALAEAEEEDNQKGNIDFSELDRVFTSLDFGEKDEDAFDSDDDEDENEQEMILPGEKEFLKEVDDSFIEEELDLNLIKNAGKTLAQSSKPRSSTAQKTSENRSNKGTGKRGQESVNSYDSEYEEAAEEEKDYEDISALVRKKKQKKNNSLLKRLDGNLRSRAKEESRKNRR